MKLYQTLLHFYPASFRADYGEEMTAVFARRRRDANWAALAWLWIETVIDVLWNAALVHLDILGQDLRYAARTLGRAPGFTITAIAVAGDYGGVHHGESCAAAAVSVRTTGAAGETV